MTESGSKPESSPKIAARANWAVWLATGFGIGFIRFAPGTWGSLLAMPMALGVWLIPAWGPIPAGLLQAIIVVAVCAVGVPIATRAGHALGRGKDPGCIVIDEIAGILITFLFMPISAPPIDTLFVGFFFFRLFDILKPPPARQLERLPAGLGIMADDWAAAVYANVSLQFSVRYVLPLLPFQAPFD